MSGDRDRLAAALEAHLGIVLEDLVDALLPAVRAIAADELRAAVADYAPVTAIDSAWLLGRADALDSA